MSCEHGGREVPPPYAPLFHGSEDILEGHRGYDRGSLELARHLSARLAGALFAAKTTRLLVDLNRSPRSPSLFSEFSRDLPPRRREEILRSIYRPYRVSVESEVQRRVSRGQTVLHIAVHSFAPSLRGEERRADVGLLYDPRRTRERAFVERWRRALRDRFPGLRVRRNYPYLGVADGLATHLRRTHPDSCYLGIELEVNQSFSLEGGVRWRHLQETLASSGAEALERSRVMPDRPGPQGQGRAG